MRSQIRDKVMTIDRQKREGIIQIGNPKTRFLVFFLKKRAGSSPHIHIFFHYYGGRAVREGVEVKRREAGRVLVTKTATPITVDKTKRAIGTQQVKSGHYLRFFA